MVFLCSLKEAEKPFCERLHRVRDLMDRSKVSIEEVISELGQYLMIFDLISRLLRGFSLSIFFWCPVSSFHILLLLFLSKASNNQRLCQQEHVAAAALLCLFNMLVFGAASTPVCFSDFLSLNIFCLSFQVTALRLSTQSPLPSSASSTACSHGNAFQRSMAAWRGQ